MLLPNYQDKRNQTRDCIVSVSRSSVRIQLKFKLRKTNEQKQYTFEGITLSFTSVCDDGQINADRFMIRLNNSQYF